MRHRKKGKKFHRITGRRRTFLRNLVNDLIRQEKIETTEARAKAIRPIAERLLTIAKKQTPAAERLLISRVHNKAIADKLFTELSLRYQDRVGGYLRITKSAKGQKRNGNFLATIAFV